MAATAVKTYRKVVFVGDSAVGKTTLMIRQTTGEFPTEYVPTVFGNYVCGLRPEDPCCGLALWDSAGGEDYDRLRPLSYPDTDIVVICFECSNPASLVNVESKWVPELTHHIPRVPFILACTKIDLRGEERVIRMLAESQDHISTTEEGKAVAKRIGALRYMETSSRTNVGVPELFFACQGNARNAGRDRGRSGPVCTLL